MVVFVFCLFSVLKTFAGHIIPETVNSVADLLLFNMPINVFTHPEYVDPLDNTTFKVSYISRFILSSEQSGFRSSSSFFRFVLSYLLKKKFKTRPLFRKEAVNESKILITEGDSALAVSVEEKADPFQYEPELGILQDFDFPDFLPDLPGSTLFLEEHFI